MTRTLFDVEQLRADFPILDREIHPGVPLTYLDSTATAQKPNAVIEAMNELRVPVDTLEGIIPADMWPLPSYAEMLFML